VGQGGADSTVGVEHTKLDVAAAKKEVSKELVQKIQRQAVITGAWVTATGAATQAQCYLGCRMEE
jgi:hypothetical protein